MFLMNMKRCDMGRLHAKMAPIPADDFDRSTRRMLCV